MRVGRIEFGPAGVKVIRPSAQEWTSGSVESQLSAMTREASRLKTENADLRNQVLRLTRDLEAARIRLRRAGLEAS